MDFQKAYEVFLKSGYSVVQITEKKVDLDLYFPEDDIGTSLGDYVNSKEKKISYNVDGPNGRPLLDKNGKPENFTLSEVTDLVIEKAEEVKEEIEYNC